MNQANTLEVVIKVLKLSRTKTLLIVIGVILLSACALLALKPHVEEKEPVTYQKVQVSKGDIRAAMDTDGTIEFSKVDLRFGVKGTIAEILVEEGNEVQKGDIIAKLDDESYLDQYQLSQAKLKDAQEQELTALLNDELKVQKTKTELETLKDEYTELAAIPEAYSPSDLKTKKMELNNKELEYNNILKTHQILVDNYENNNQEEDQNELAVKIAQENLDDTILYSPVSGTLINMDKKVGESVTDEQDVAVVHENNQVKATTKVIEYDINQLKLEQLVYISAEALPDEDFTGKVSNIDILPSSDSSGLVSYAVEITIINPTPDLRDGMTCTASFILKEVKDCLIVPFKAVKVVNGKQLVTVVDNFGEHIDKTIKTGFTDGTNVEVTEGLKVNDTVILSTQSR